MAQIFVSHSGKDRELVDVLARAFAATKVKAVYEEFEAILHGPATAQRILHHISQSNAVFVVIGKHVEENKHTRDWVGFESGAASGSTLQAIKDVWVLESLAETDTLSVVIPRLQHYICFDHKDERWQAYLTQIIGSYDDSHVLTAMAAGGLAGAAVGRAEGAVAGIGAGLLLACMTSQTRPMGFPLRCPQCSSVYNVHLAVARMRCPVCNARLIVGAMTDQQHVSKSHA
jgi:hypothetical protein